MGAKNNNVTGGNFRTSFDAEKNIEYLDGTQYKHIKNMEYMFNDIDRTECFEFQEDHKFGDKECTDIKKIICEYTYNCTGMKEMSKNIVYVMMYSYS